MARARPLVLLILGGLLLSCGGDSSPTEPDPVPVTLAGDWAGEMSGSVGGADFTCPLELDLSGGEDGIFFGGWRARCPGADVTGTVSAVSIFGFVQLIGLRSTTAPAPHPLGTCGWGATVTLRGSELSGDWVVPDGCADASLAGGPLRLRFEG
jgi:hypothetical protein